MASIPVREPSYMHSFAITENHVVLVEFPLVVNPLRLAGGGTSFIESYRWRPERGTRVTVVDKRTGESRDAGTCAPMFSFHHVNAFERDGEIVLDLVAYDDASIIDRLFLSELRDGAKGARVGTVRRLRVPLAGGTVGVEELSPERLDLPRIDYARCNGRDYRVVYGAGQADEDSFFDQLVKLDVTTGRSITWREPGTHPGEPVFVPAPGASRRTTA